MLLRHPAVAAAAVFPVPSEMAEDEVAAAVVLEPRRVVDPRELIEHCIPRLAYFAVPRYIEFVDELPLTENGKVRKAVLRERGITRRDVGPRGGRRAGVGRGVSRAARGRRRDARDRPPSGASSAAQLDRGAGAGASPARRAITTGPAVAPHRCEQRRRRRAVTSSTTPRPASRRELGAAAARADRARRPQRVRRRRAQAGTVKRPAHPARSSTAAMWQAPWR